MTEEALLLPLDDDDDRVAGGKLVGKVGGVIVDVFVFFCRSFFIVCQKN